MFNTIAGLLSGLVVGSLSGLVGIGGGILLVPLLLYVFKVDMHVAAGTSLAIIIPTAVIGSIVHFSRGNVNWQLAIIIAAGGVIGSFIGSWAGNMISGDVLKKIFAVVLVVLSVKIATDAFRPTPQTEPSSAQAKVEVASGSQEG